MQHYLAININTYLAIIQYLYTFVINKEKGEGNGRRSLLLLIWLTKPILLQYKT